MLFTLSRLTNYCKYHILLVIWTSSTGLFRFYLHSPADRRHSGRSRHCRYRTGVNLPPLRTTPAVTPPGCFIGLLSNYAAFFEWVVGAVYLDQRGLEISAPRQNDVKYFTENKGSNFLPHTTFIWYYEMLQMSMLL